MTSARRAEVYKLSKLSKNCSVYIKANLKPFPTNQIKSVFRGVMLKSRQAREYEKNLKLILADYTCFKNHFSSDDFLTISFKVHSPGVLTKKGKKSKTFIDWDNCIKFTQDIIFQELLPECDDSQIIFGSVTMLFDADEFFEVEIRKVDGFGVC
jgi:Holliday junction resolvase RusA-like endonuclease